MKRSNLESVFNVTLHFSVVVEQVDDPGVLHFGSVPQDEDDQKVLFLRKVQEGSHVVDQCSATVRSADESISVEFRRILTFHVHPNTWPIKLKVNYISIGIKQTQIIHLRTEFPPLLATWVRNPSSLVRDKLLYLSLPKS